MTIPWIVPLVAAACAFGQQQPNGVHFELVDRLQPGCEDGALKSDPFHCDIDVLQKLDLASRAGSPALPEIAQGEGATALG